MNLMAVKQVILEILDIDPGLVSLHSVSRNRDEALGIYPRRGTRPRQEIIGCGNRAYEISAITLLLRWGRDGVAAEEKAAEIYSLLTGQAGGQKHFEYNGRKGFIMAVFDAPVWLGMDSRGVFEYAIDIDFYSFCGQNACG
jgi:hypothetical protein